MAANSLNPENPACSFATESYHSMLQESIQFFLSQLESGISTFSHFNLMFSRLIQTMASPPIEVIWFYSAVNFQTQKDTAALYDRISALKDLFHSLVLCTGPRCSSLKKVGVLAPLTFELYNLIFDLKKNNRFSSEKAIVAEISCLIQRLVSFISLCCCQGVNDHDDTLAFSPCFVDLVKVWTFQRRESCYEFEDDFKMFFPLIGGEIRNRFLVGSSVGVLAGIVMWQAFLLSLYLCLQEKDVLSLAVSTITGFRSFYFFDTLLKMLLESTLPVTTLLTVFEELLLRQSMFDAIILVDYPFFNHGCGIHFCIHHLNSLASTWLFVADKAMQFVWHNGAHNKFIAYKKAFSKSLIHHHLMKWVSTQIVLVEDADRINLSTPAAFMEWLVQLPNQASRRFTDGEFSVLIEKALNYTSEMKTALPYAEVDVNDQKEGGDDGDFEMIDSTTGCNSNNTDGEASGKRKGERGDCGIQVKVLKYQIHDSPIKNFMPLQNEVGFIRRS